MSIDLYNENFAAEANYIHNNPCHPRWDLLRIHMITDIVLLFYHNREKDFEILQHYANI